MDPHPPISMDPPPPTTDPTLNHIAQAANPTPHHPPTTPNHPPYAEMITAAIAALKERNGSSKKAIAKYIDRVYTNLPSTHSALLTHHLKRLKTNGQLTMVKHSYKLPPRSAPPPLPNNNAAVDLATVGLVHPTQPKKRPGRPPKPKPTSLSPAQAQNFNVGLVYPAQNFVPIVGPGQGYNVTVGPGQNQYQNFAVGPVPVVQKRKPGRPAKPKPGVTPVAQYIVPPPVAQNTTLPPPPVAQSNGAVVGAEAVFVSLGLADGPPAKRRPGRPRKVDLAGPQQPRPNPIKQSGPKRKPGRPTKNGPVPEPNGIAPVGPLSGKPRGRPKRDASVVVNGPVTGQPKRRGRQPKNVQAVVRPAAVVVPQVEASAAIPGAVMVPYAQGPVAVPGGVPLAPVPVPVAVNGVPPPPAAGKRRGRPPRANNVGPPKKARNLTGKPLGRPKKNASPPDPSQHLAAYIDLKCKLEYLQSRIKQTVSVIKPCIEAGTSARAMGALQQLEELATVVVNDGAVNVQGQEAVQQV